ncbi:MAG TPA: VCBS repeat-containing protein, partial [Planctomycetaceae bacterium]|nr:VCBS repeat-containing protein [Planctomycetaceae bacterium]
MAWNPQSGGERTMKTRVWLWQIACSLLTIPIVAQAGAPQTSLKWKLKLLTVDSNEGCALADFNRDGRLDIVAGRNWYAAPDFIPRPVRSIDDWNGYVDSNGDYAYDVDGDGWTDVIAGSFIPTEVYWYRNPGKDALMQGKQWPKQLLVDTGASANEGQALHDIDGDGVPECVVNSWKKGSPFLVWRFAKQKRTVTEVRGRKQVQVERLVPTLKKVVINRTGNGHGLAFGDVNGDGREDILCGTGWYERPAEGIFQREWTYHPDWQLHASVPFLVRDLNGDGLNDLIWSKAHDFGLYWWEQLAPDSSGKTQWKEHLIDKSWSQAHCLLFADIDGDGQ